MTDKPSRYDVERPALDLPDFFPKDMRDRWQNEHDTFFICYGRAISAWIGVERAFGSVYLASQFESWGGPRHMSLMTAFHQVANWRSRLEMVDASVRILRLPNKLREEWSPLYNKATKLAQTRNSIVHMGVVSFMQGQPGKQYYLSDNAENLTNHPQVSGKPRRSFYAADLIDTEARFKAFAQRVSNWGLALEIQLGLDPFEASPAPATGQRGSGTQDDQTPKEPPRPP